jgi:hypothetical protein
MGFTLDKVVPWGRSFYEYVAMFDLSEEDYTRQILGCGDGPASFNSVFTKSGGRIVSVDPIYRFSRHEIRNRIDETYKEVLDQTRRNAEEFVWQSIASVEELGSLRIAAMEAFLEDFPTGLSEGRYVEGALLSLPFDDGAFDLAICSHFLFLYSEQFSKEFHLDSIRELCRVAREVRIFPLLELGSKRSRHLDAVVTELGAEGYRTNIKRVPYEFQRGGNQMLKVCRDIAG